MQIAMAASQSFLFPTHIQGFVPGIESIASTISLASRSSTLRLHSVATHCFPISSSCSQRVSQPNLNSRHGKLALDPSLGIRSSSHVGQQARTTELCFHACRYAKPESNGDVEGAGSKISIEVTQPVQEGWQWSKTNRELAAYGLLLAAVPVVPFLPRYEWSGSLYFLFLALWSVYVGSYRSLERKPPQSISLQEGLVVPFICSLSLLGFYCLLRYFPTLDLQTFISAYLGLVGSIAVARNLLEPMRYLFPRLNSHSWQIDIPPWLIQNDGQPVHITVTAADCIALFVGFGAGVANKHVGALFTLNNFIAVCIVTELLQLLSLGSFITAATMLSGLLLYDVFWVFGSSHVFGDNVMVTVATSTVFDGPMKLIFPQWKGNAVNSYSILGLGDVAAPGLLISLMLRFDRSRSIKSNSKACAPSDVAAPAPPVESVVDGEFKGMPDKSYFVTCMASYVIGLSLTVFANSVSGAAQPALLYIVPSLLIGVFLTAAFRSEASMLLKYKDGALVSPITVNINEEMSD